MADALALVALFDAVVSTMDADAAAASATPVPHLFGWREPAHHSEETGAGATGTGRRIVWVPGDDGAVGDFRPARWPGRNPRPLATLGEACTVYLEAQDPASPEDEKAQYIAVRRLFDAWYRAAYLAAISTLEIDSIRYVNDQTVRRFGATIRVVFTIQAMIPDAPLEEVAGVADPYTIAVGTTEELDQIDGPDMTGPTPPAARAATTADVALSGEQTIDGVALVAGNRVLVKAQTAAAENGPYTVAVGAWSRTADALVSGFFVHVEEGTANGDAGFELTTPDPIVVGTTPLAFARVSP